MTESSSTARPRGRGDPGFAQSNVHTIWQSLDSRVRGNERMWQLLHSFWEETYEQRRAFDGSGLPNGWSNGAMIGPAPSGKGLNSRLDRRAVLRAGAAASLGMLA